MKNKGSKQITEFLFEILAGILIGATMLPLVISMLLITIKSEPWHLAVIFPAIILEYLVLTAAHEAGHLVFGLMSGYGFSSYRIGGLMWIKLPDGVKLRRMSIAGTGGQCLMIPPKAEKGKIPVFLYNLGGAFMNLALCILLFVAYLLTRGVAILPHVFILGAEFSLIMAVFNGLPMRIGGIANDGMNAFSLRNDIHANDAFNKQLLINAEQTRGTRISDMPREWFELSPDADMNNPLCATIPAFYCSRLMDEGLFEETEKCILQLINGDNGLMGMYRGLLVSDLIYCLILKGDKDRARRYYTKEQRKFMGALRGLPGVLRTEYAVAISEIDGAGNAEKIKRSFDKTIKKYPYPSDAELEKRLISLVEKSEKNRGIK